MERLVVLYEWFCFVFRKERDVRLGQHVDRLIYAPKQIAKRSPHVVRTARRYISFMNNADQCQRYTDTLIRAGY